MMIRSEINLVKYYLYKMFDMQNYTLLNQHKTLLTNTL